MRPRLSCRIGVACALELLVLAASAQSRPPTTEQLGRDPGALRQEAEQQRAQERAQQQQAGQQQADQQWNDTVRQQQSRANADIAQGQAVRRTWQQRPPLAPERNPLLGRWTSTPPAQRPGPAGVSPEIAKMASELIGGMTSGLCDSMLGQGTIEFRAGGPVGLGRDGRERPMYRAEYRGGGSRVVVLPQGGTTFTHMIIDFIDPDHATVAGVGCGLRRGGASDSARAGARESAATKQTAMATMEARGTEAGAAAATGGVLSLSILSGTTGSINVANRKLWVLKKEPRLALIQAGLPDTAYGNALQNWIRACQAREPACQQGALALKPYTMGVATTDADGHAQSPPLPAGRYWVFGDGKVDNRPMLWNQPVDVKAGPASVTLDQRNASPVN